MADPMYLDALERGAEFLTGTADDRVGQFLENPDAPANTSHVAVVQSQLANGAFARGVATGIEIAKRATAIGGIPTSFLLATTGTYAGCVWITSGTSIRELEQGEQAVNSDPGFIELIDREAPTCFVEGITTQEIWRRIV
jgi:hypothetical protein